MAKFNVRASVKHIQISNANTLMLIAAAITTSVVVFSVIAANTLYKQMTYQNKVISLQSKANKQLEKNIKAVDTLKDSYQTFEESSESVIGTPDKNSKIILDALPSKYDFPATATSIDGMITGSGAKTVSISGTDDEATAKQDSVDPQPVEIPFQFNANGSYTIAQKLITDMQRSIRPYQITKLVISGSDNNMKINVTAKTYYQPEKKLEVQKYTVTGPNKTKSKTTSRTTK